MERTKAEKTGASIVEPILIAAKLPPQSEQSRSISKIAFTGNPAYLCCTEVMAIWGTGCKLAIWALAAWRALDQNQIT